MRRSSFRDHTRSAPALTPAPPKSKSTCHIVRVAWVTEQNKKTPSPTLYTPPPSPDTWGFSVAFSGPRNQDEPRFLLWRRGRAEAGERCEASRQQHLTTGPSPIFEDGKNNYVHEDMAQVRHAPPLQFPACSAFACTFQGPYTAHTHPFGGVVIVLWTPRRTSCSFMT